MTLANALTGIESTRSAARHTPIVQLADADAKTAERSASTTGYAHAVPHCSVYTGLLIDTTRDRLDGPWRGWNGSRRG